MRIDICGCRGSTQAVGTGFARYGGHTSCVALSHDGAPPSLLLDAGTGIRRVRDLLGEEPFRGSILLGHLHWDHTHGLPFFRSGDDERSRVAVHVPVEVGHDPVTVLERGFSPPHFPIRPTELRGDWSFHRLHEGTLEVEGFTVLVRDIPHKGGRTVGFRVSDGIHTVGYLSDHHPTAIGPGDDGFGALHPAALELASDVDLLLHDAQYTPLEWPTRSHFGHSTVGYAVRLAETAGARRLMLYHHDPARTDDEIDALVSACRGSTVLVEAAAEGATVHLAGARTDHAPA